jgi:hypothetical protein
MKLIILLFLYLQLVITIRLPSNNNNEVLNNRMPFSYNITVDNEIENQKENLTIVLNDIAINKIEVMIINNITIFKNVEIFANLTNVKNLLGENYKEVKNT